jgi:hypothetical protein
MAREEADREDLIAEATALVERAELELAGLAEPLVAGFRRDGCLSLYFGQDPVYHFNRAGELRRAFVDGLLYKAVGGRLCSLRRNRIPGETQLIGHDLSDAEAALVLRALTAQLQELQATIRAGQFQELREVSPSKKVVERLTDWLGAHAAAVLVAAAPSAR